jgi:hypothetical protein
MLLMLLLPLPLLLKQHKLHWNHHGPLNQPPQVIQVPHQVR